MYYLLLYLIFYTSPVNDEFWDVNTAESEKFKPVEAVQVTWDKVKFATTGVGFKDVSYMKPFGIRKKSHTQRIKIILLCYHRVFFSNTVQHSLPKVINQVMMCYRH